MVSAFEQPCLSLHFPALPVDYGYRDSKIFRFYRKTGMRAELLQMRQASPEPPSIKDCVDWAKENSVALITEEHK